jgi:hypothetical protein
MHARHLAPQVFDLLRAGGGQVFLGQVLGAEGGLAGGQGLALDGQGGQLGRASWAAAGRQAQSAASAAVVSNGGRESVAKERTSGRANVVVVHAFREDCPASAMQL